MKRLHKIVMLMCLLLLSGTAFAQAQIPAEGKPKIFEGLELYPPNSSLEEQAVILAAKSDAMNMTCGKDTQLAVAYLKKFAEKGIALSELKRLEQLGVVTLEQRVQILVDAKTPCKDSDFLLERFRVMKELRAVSYRLQGVDPNTVPSAADFSEIEKLLPKDDQVLKDGAQ